MIDEHAHIFGSLAVCTGLINSAYVLWLTSTGRIKPHAFSVLIWLIVASVTFANLIEQGAGAAAWRTGILSIVYLINLGFCIRNGFGYITRSDVVVFICALSSIPIWILSSAETSLYWLILVQTLGTIPTVRKAYSLPYELSVIVYLITSIGFLLQYLALETYSAGMVLYFIIFALQYGFLASILLFRRTKVTRPAV